MLQSWTSSAITVLVVVRTTPAASIRRRASSSCTSYDDPEASNTANTSKPSWTALIAGKIRQMSVVTAAMMSFLRPMARTAPLKFKSAHALTIPVRLMRLA